LVTAWAFLRPTLIAVFTTGQASESAHVSSSLVWALLIAAVVPDVGLVATAITTHASVSSSFTSSARRIALVTKDVVWSGYVHEVAIRALSKASSSSDLLDHSVFLD